MQFCWRSFSMARALIRLLTMEVHHAAQTTVLPASFLSVQTPPRPAPLPGPVGGHVFLRVLLLGSRQPACTAALQGHCGGVWSGSPEGICSAYSVRPVSPPRPAPSLPDRALSRPVASEPWADWPRAPMRVEGSADDGRGRGWGRSEGKGSRSHGLPCIFM